MTKIISTPNCGNSPKMQFIKEFNIAFAKGDVAFIIESIADNIVWDIISSKKIEGKENFVKALNKMKSIQTTELKLEQILSHGKQAAANGIITLESGKKYAFSDFYLFKSAKGAQIQSLTSYVIEV
ncbi:hypothetical protein JoomaDRAFT_3564 [Galbibacter orientalis DSM 19592]|uniref:SnoaL-like domain-containing protein n=1 Tax=Galbibacter orientalis DSM 19592 TaxID=926559 RepID=I3CA59_9FLAO|nr:DNA-binding protein [Galbibacter orientalis]EIJ40502.1 hypothetical protein JoomaDRAFT_3564 [Galbibacter orientalis DSM 19592]|tara:strand:- start:109 stop:486 length:378 start_codon:yes stop_codon:yes gene_type:complete